MSRLFCKSLLLTPSLVSAPIRFSFKSISSPSSTSRVHRMATEASSSPSSNADREATSSSSSAPASSAIDFLSLCHRLKVIKFVYSYFCVFGCGNGFWIVWFWMCICSYWELDYETSWMGEERCKGSRVYSWPYVPNGINGSDCFWYPRCRSRQVEFCDYFNFYFYGSRGVF